MASLKQSSSISSKPVETANAFDEALECFQEICERKKSKDDHQTELIQKLLEECNAVDVQGGYAETIVDYSLPKKIRRLPIVRFVVTTRVAMKPETVNRRVTRAVKEHMGETEHVVCPDKIKGNDTETHTFVIVSPTGLKYSLEKLLSGVQEAKDALLVLYNASKNKSKSWKNLTLTPRVCIRFQVGAYILCNASELDLEKNENWKHLEKSLDRSLNKSVKSDTDGVNRAQEILMDAARKISSSNTPLEKGTNSPQGSSPLRGSTKRQRPSDLVDDQEPRDAACLMRPRSGGDGSGDTSEQNADGSAFDGSPDSVLPHCGPSNPGSDTGAGISRHSHPQDKLCHLVRLCSSILYKAHALGILSIDNSAMLVHVTHEGLIRDLKALCKRKNDEMQAATILSGMRGRK
ncbi:hypothetical protein PSENEW3_00003321 [Picochlorum sp. SENEW3]|nr:hypothetical protein PSENEW3_00003321 [Picochlorum sp. SENEW3]